MQRPLQTARIAGNAHARTLAVKGEREALASSERNNLSRGDREDLCEIEAHDDSPEEEQVVGTR